MSVQEKDGRNHGNVGKVFIMSVSRTEKKMSEANHPTA